MDTFAAIESRRSVKKFDPNHKMTEQEIDKLMAAVMLTPTSFNIQNWRFVVITDDAVKQKFQEAGYNQVQFGDCSVIVLVCGDRQAYAKDTERYWVNAPQEAREALVKMIRGYYDASESARSQESIRSGGMAAMTLMLAARAMGLDSCPMGGFDFGKAAQLVNLPADHDIVMAVTVGKALETARERAGQIPMSEVCFRNSF